MKLSTMERPLFSLSNEEVEELQDLKLAYLTDSGEEEITASVTSYKALNIATKIPSSVKFIRSAQLLLSPSTNDEMTGEDTSILTRLKPPYKQVISTKSIKKPNYKSEDTAKPVHGILLGVGTLVRPDKKKKPNAPRRLLSSLQLKGDNDKNEKDSSIFQSTFHHQNTPTSSNAILEAFSEDIHIEYEEIVDYDLNTIELCVATEKRHKVQENLRRPSVSETLVFICPSLQLKKRTDEIIILEDGFKNALSQVDAVYEFANNRDSGPSLESSSKRIPAYEKADQTILKYEPLTESSTIPYEEPEKWQKVRASLGEGSLMTLKQEQEGLIISETITSDAIKEFEQPLIKEEKALCRPDILRPLTVEEQNIQGDLKRWETDVKEIKGELEVIEQKHVIVSDEKTNVITPTKEFISEPLGIKSAKLVQEELRPLSISHTDIQESEEKLDIKDIAKKTATVGEIDTQTALIIQGQEPVHHVAEHYPTKAEEDFAKLDILPQKAIEITEFTPDQKEKDFKENKIKGENVQREMELSRTVVHVTETRAESPIKDIEKTLIPENKAMASFVPHTPLEIKSDVCLSDTKDFTTAPAERDAAVTEFVPHRAFEITQEIPQDREALFKKDARSDIFAEKTIETASSAVQVLESDVEYPLNPEKFIIPQSTSASEEYVLQTSAVIEEAAINEKESALFPFKSEQVSADISHSGFYKPLTVFKNEPLDETGELSTPSVTSASAKIDFVSSRAVEVITQGLVDKESELKPEKPTEVNIQSSIDERIPLMTTEVNISSTVKDLKEREKPQTEEVTVSVIERKAVQIHQHEFHDKESEFMGKFTDQYSATKSICTELEPLQISEVKDEESTVNTEIPELDKERKAIVCLGEPNKLAVMSDITPHEKEEIKPTERPETKTAKASVDAYDSLIVSDVKVQSPVKEDNPILDMPKEKGVLLIIPNKGTSVTEVSVNEKEDLYSAQEIPSLSLQAQLQPGEQALVVQETQTSGMTSELVEIDTTKELANTTFIPYNAILTSSDILTSDKETPFLVEKPISEEANVQLQLLMHSTQTSEVLSHETSLDFKGDKPELGIKATVGIGELTKVPLASDVILIEKEGYQPQDIIDKQTASTDLSLHDSVIISETQTHFPVKEEDHKLIMSTEKGICNILHSKPVTISEVILQEKEENYAPDKLSSVSVKSELQPGDQALVVEETQISLNTTEFTEAQTAKELADTTYIPYDAVLLATNVIVSDKEKAFVEEKPVSESAELYLELEKNSTQISEISSHETSVDFKEDKPDLTRKATRTIREGTKAPVATDVMVIEKEGHKPDELINVETASKTVDVHDSIQVSEMRSQSPIKEENMKITMTAEIGTCDIIQSKPVSVSEVILQEKEETYAPDQTPSLTVKTELQPGELALVVEETQVSTGTIEFAEKETAKESADVTFIPHNAAILGSNVLTSEKETTFTEKKPDTDAAEVHLELENITLQTSEVSSQETSVEFKDDKPDLTQKATVTIREGTKAPVATDVMIIEKEGYKPDELINGETASKTVDVHDSIQVSEMRSQSPIKEENMKITMTAEVGTCAIIQSKPVSVSEVILQEKEQTYTPDQMPSLTVKTELQPGEQALVIEETQVSTGTIEFAEKETAKESADVTFIPHNAAILGSNVLTSEKETAFTEKKPDTDAAEVHLELENITLQTSEVSSQETSVEFKDDKPDLTQKATVTIREGTKAPVATDVMIIEKEGYKPDELINGETASKTVDVHDSIQVSEMRSQSPIKEENMKITMTAEVGTYAIIQSKPVSVSEVILQEKEETYTPDQMPSLTVKTELQPGELALVVEETQVSTGTIEFAEKETAKESADVTFIPHNAAILGSNVLTSEKETTFTEKKPDTDAAEVHLELENITLQTSEVSSQETSVEFKDDKPDLTQKATVTIREGTKAPVATDVMIIEKEGYKPDELINGETASKTVDVYDSIQVSEMRSQSPIKEENMKITMTAEQGTCDIIRSKPVSVSEVILQEKEETYTPDQMPSLTVKTELQPGEQALVVEETQVSTGTIEFAEKETAKESADVIFIPHNAAILGSNVLTSEKETTFTEMKPDTDAAEVHLELENITLQTSEVSSQETSVEFKDDKADLTQKATVTIREGTRAPVATDVMIIEKEGYKPDELINEETASKTVDVHDSIQVSEMRSQSPIKEENMKITMTAEQGTCDIIRSKPVSVSEVILQEKEETYTPDQMPSLTVKTELQPGEQALVIEETQVSTGTIEFAEKETAKESADVTFIPHNAAILGSNVLTSEKETTFTEKKPDTDAAEVHLELENITLQTSEVSSQETPVEFKDDKPDLTQKATVTIREGTKAPVATDVMIIEKEGYKPDELINGETASKTVDVHDSIQVSEMRSQSPIKEENMKITMTAEQGTCDIIRSKPVSVSEVILQEKEETYTPHQMPSLTVKTELQPGEQALVVEETQVSTGTIEFAEKETAKESADVTFIPHNAAILGSNVLTSEKETTFTECKPDADAAEVHLELENITLQTSEVSSQETSVEFKDDKPDLTQKATVTIREGTKAPIATDVMIIEKEGYKPDELINEETASKTIDVYDSIQVSEMRSQSPVKDDDMKLNVATEKGTCDIIQSKPVSVSEIIIQEKEEEYSPDKVSTITISSELQPGDQALVVEETQTSINTTEFTEKETTQALADASFIPLNMVPIASDVEISDKEKLFKEDEPAMESAKFDLELEKPSMQTSEVSSHEVSVDFNREKPDLGTKATVTIGELAKVPLTSDVILIEKEGYQDDEKVKKETAGTSLNLLDSVMVSEMDSQYAATEESMDIQSDTAYGTLDVIPSKIASVSEIMLHDKEESYTPEIISIKAIEGEMQPGEEPLIVQETMASLTASEFTEKPFDKNFARAAFIPINAVPVASDVEISDKEKIFGEEKPQMELADFNLEVEKHSMETSEVSSHETSVDFKGEKPDLGMTASVTIGELAKVPLTFDVMVIEKEGYKPEEFLQKETAGTALNLLDSLMVSEMESNYSVAEESMELTSETARGTFNVIPSKTASVSVVTLHEKEEDYSPENISMKSIQGKIQPGDEPLIVEETLTSMSASEFDGKPVDTSTAKTMFIPINAVPIASDVEVSDKEKVFEEDKPLVESVDVTLELEKHSMETSQVSSHETSIEFKGDKPDLGTTATITIGELTKLPLSSDVMIIEKEGYKMEDVRHEETAGTTLDLLDSVMVSEMETHYPVTEESMEITPDTAHGKFNIVPSKTASVSEVTLHEKEEDYSPEGISLKAIEGQMELGDEPLIVEETLTSMTASGFIDQPIDKSFAKTTYIPINAVPVASDVEISDKEKAFEDEKPQMESAEINLEIEKHSMETSEVSSHETSIDFKGEKPNLGTTANITISELAKVPLSSDIMVIEKEGYNPEEILKKETASTALNLLDSVLVSEMESHYSLGDQSMELISDTAHGTLDVVPSKTASVSQVTLHEKEEEYSPESISVKALEGKMQPGDEPLIVEETITSMTVSDFTENDMNPSTAETTFIPINAVVVASDVEINDKEKIFEEIKPSLESVVVNLEIEKLATETSQISSHETSIDFTGDKPNLGVKPNILIGEAAKVPISFNVMVIEKEGYKPDEVLETGTGKLDIVPSKTAEVWEVVLHEKEESYNPESTSAVSIEGNVEPGVHAILIQETVTSGKTDEFTEEGPRQESAEQVLIPFSEVVLASEVTMHDKEDDHTVEKVPEISIDSKTIPTDKAVIVEETIISSQTTNLPEEMKLPTDEAESKPVVTPLQLPGVYNPSLFEQEGSPVDYISADKETLDISFRPHTHTEVLQSEINVIPGILEEDQPTLVSGRVAFEPASHISRSEEIPIEPLLETPRESIDKKQATQVIDTKETISISQIEPIDRLEEIQAEAVPSSVKAGKSTLPKFGLNVEEVDVMESTSVVETETRKTTHGTAIIPQSDHVTVTEVKVDETVSQEEQVKPKMQSAEKILSKQIPLNIEEVKIHEGIVDLKEFKEKTETAKKDVAVSDSVQISEVHIEDSVAKRKPEEPTWETAKRILSPQEPVSVAEVRVEDKTEALKTVKTDENQAKLTMPENRESVVISQVITEETSTAIVSEKPAQEKPSLISDLSPLHSLIIEEISSKEMPESISSVEPQTEKADSILSPRETVTVTETTAEQKAEEIKEDAPTTEKAEFDISGADSLQIIEISSETYPDDIQEIPTKVDTAEVSVIKGELQRADQEDVLVLKAPDKAKKKIQIMDGKEKPEEEEIVEETTEVTIKKRPKTKKTVQETVEEVSETVKISEEQKPEKAEMEEITEEITIKKRPKKKKPVEETVEEVSETLKIGEEPKPEKPEVEEITEEITIKKRPKKKKPVEETVEEVSETLKISEEPKPEKPEVEEIIEEITIKKRPKKKKPVEETVEEVSETLKISEEPKPEKPEVEEITEEITIKKRPKKKKPVEETVEEVSETLKISEEPKPEKPEVEEITEEITIKKRPKKKKPVEETVEEVSETLKISEEPKPEKPEVEEITEEITIKKRPKKKQPVDETVEEVSETLKISEEPKPEKPEVEEITEEITIKKRPKKRKPVEETVEEVIETLKISEEPKPDRSEMEEITEEITIKKRPKKKKPVEEIVEEVSETLKITEEPKPEKPEVEEITEEITIKKRPKKKKPVEETVEEVSETLKISEEPKPEKPVVEEITEEITIKKRPKKQKLVEERVEEVSETLKIGEEPKPEKPDVEEITEEITIKKRPKKKKPVEETVEEVSETLKISEEPKPEKPEVEEITEEITIKKRPKKQKLVEESVEEVSETLKIGEEPKTEKPEVEEITEEITIKKRPKKKKPVEESVEEVSETLKISEEPKPEKPEVEEITEEITIKKRPKKKKPVEESVEEVSETLKISEEPKPEKPEVKEITEEITIKKRPKKKKQVEETVEEVTETLKISEEPKPDKPEVEEIIEEITIKKRPKKKKPVEETVEEVSETLTISKEPKPEKTEVGEFKPEEAIEEIVEQFTIKKKPKKKMTVQETLEEVSETLKITEEQKPEKPEFEEITEETAEVTLKRKPKKKTEEYKIEEETAEVTIKKKPKKSKPSEETLEEISQTIKITEQHKPETSEFEDTEETKAEFTVKRKPKKPESPKEEDVSESVTIQRPPSESNEIEETTTDVSIKRKPKKKPVEEDQEASVTLQRAPSEPKEEDTIATFNIRRKSKVKPIIRDEGEEEVAISLSKPKERKPSQEDVSESFVIKRKPKIKDVEENVSIDLPESIDYTTEETTADVKIKMKRPKREYQVAEESAESKVVIEGPEEEPEDIIIEEDHEIIKRYEIDATKATPELISETVKISKPRRKKPYQVENVEDAFTLKKKPEKQTEEFEESAVFKQRSPSERDEDTLTEGSPVEGEFTFDILNKETIKRKIQEIEAEELVKVPRVPRRSPAVSQEGEHVQEAHSHSSEEHVVEITLPHDVKPGDQLRAISTYLVEDEHENAMHLIEGERVIIQECTNSDWWFVEKHLTKERGYVPAKLLAEENAYIVFVQKKLEEKIDKLPTFDKPKKGQKASAPKIIQRVEPQVVVDGQEVQFTCKVEGIPRPTITWFRQTAIIKQSEEFQMFYSEDGTATLIIKEVFPEDAGIFTCVIKNQAGSTSSSAELIVEGPMSDHGSDSVTPSRRSLSRESSVCDLLEGIPPTFAQKSITKTSEENVTLEMDVRLVAIPEPEIIWKRDGQVVRDSNRVRIVKQKDVHAYRSLVIIKGVRKDDAGIYEIFARNREGEAKNTITLNITAPEAPEFIQKLKETTVEEGETIRLVARVKGHPTPDVTWSRNGKRLKASKDLIMSHQDGLAILEIQNANRQNEEGKYLCGATNKIGKASTTCQVHVGKDLITFKKGLESCVVKEDMEVVLECRTSKEVECEWQKNKKKLKEEPGRVSIEHQGLTHRLVISTAHVSDTGKYKCIFSETSTWCNLTVKGLEEFVKNLEDQEVMEKEEAVFQVEINNDTSDVTWHKDGQEITRDDQRFKIIKEGKTRKLILKSSTPGDQGEYTCCMGDLETTAELVVKERPPEIVRKMTDQHVYKGGKSSFEIELSKPNVVVQWFKNEDEIQFNQHLKLSVEGKVQRLTIYNCQMDDAAFFRAVIGKSECSAVLTVELQEEGDFVKKLQTQMDVTAGSDVTLTVQITKPEYDVRWLRNGEKIKPSDRVIIEKEDSRRSLILKSTKLEDAADYTCVLGKLKSICKLNVLKLESPPTIDRSQIQVEYVVKKGETVTFIVPFKATPTPTASWIRKGKQIRPEASKKYTSETTENRASITVNQVENIDCGEYRLELKNSCGNVSIDITLKILDKPSKPGWPDILQVTNDSANIHWKAPEDDGGRTITNYIVEYRLKSKTSWSVFNKNSTIKETNTVVTHLQTNEEYYFRVSAVNEIGTSEPSEESQPVKICIPKKPEPPMVLEELQPVVTGLHQTVVLRCVISGTPLPTIKWTKDSQEITSNVTYENFTATLTIRETSGSSAGMYTCRASNEAGVNECSASVVVQEAPKFEFDESLQAQCLYVGDRWQIPVKVTGFPQPKISWTRNDQPLKSSQHIIVHVEEEEGLTDIAIQKIQKDDSSVFTCIAENKAGKIHISFNLRVKEVEEEEKIIIEDKEEIRMERPGAPEGPLIITEVTSTKVQLTWKASSYDGGCEISSYCIERLIQGEKHWQKEGEVKANITSYITQDLLEQHEYFFRVFAVNAIGVSDALEGDSVFIRSRFGVPGPPLGPFDVTMLTDYSLKIQWEQPEFDGGSPITRYLVERREAFKKAWQKVGNTEADETEYEISGLKRGVSYFFRVFAINEIGQGPPYQPEEPITAGKKITVPSMPTALNVIDVTSRTVTLGWAPPATTGGADLIGYVIQSRLTSEEKWQSIATVDPSVTLFCIENLIEKSEYEFRVYAENPVGWSEEAARTEYIKLKTHATPPSPPTSPLEARPTGPTSLMIEWGAPESDGGAPLLGYTIAIRDLKRSMWIEVGQVDANFTRLHIKELQENHEYIVRVFARNEVGLSDPLELEDPIQIIRPDDFTELPEDDDAPSLSYSTTETLSWMREAGVDADIYSYARGRLLNRDEYFFKVWHQRQRTLREEEE